VELDTDTYPYMDMETDSDTDNWKHCFEDGYEYDFGNGYGNKEKTIYGDVYAYGLIDGLRNGHGYEKKDGHENGSGHGHGYEYGYRNGNGDGRG